MTEVGSLLAELQGALKALDRAKTARDTALGQWADLKTKGAASPSAAGRLPAALQMVRECDEKFSQCHAKVRELDGRLGQARARRAFEAATATSAAH
jgi:hypothetical protein